MNEPGAHAECDNNPNEPGYIEDLLDSFGIYGRESYHQLVSDVDFQQIKATMIQGGKTRKLTGDHKKDLQILLKARHGQYVITHDEVISKYILCIPL